MAWPSLFPSWKMFAWINKQVYSFPQIQWFIFLNSFPLSLVCLERDQNLHKHLGPISDHLAGVNGRGWHVLPGPGGDCRHPWAMQCSCFTCCRAFLIWCLLWWHIRASQSLWRLADSGLTLVCLNQLGGDQLQKFHERCWVLGTCRRGRLLGFDWTRPHSSCLCSSPRALYSAHTISTLVSCFKAQTRHHVQCWSKVWEVWPTKFESGDLKVTTHRDPPQEW